MQVPPSGGVIGRCQVDEMALRLPSVGRSIFGANPVSASGSRWHSATHTRRSDGTGQYAGRRAPAASATRQRSGGSKTGAPASAPPPTRRHATAHTRTSDGTRRHRDGYDGGVVPHSHRRGHWFDPSIAHQHRTEAGRHRVRPDSKRDRTDASRLGSRSAPPPSADPLSELTGLLVLTQLSLPDGEVVGRAQSVGVVLAQDAAASGQGVLG